MRSCQVTSAVHAYDASACRLRWAQLDHEACGLMREAERRQAAGLAPFESSPPPAAPAAAPTVSAGDPARPRGGAAEAEEEEESEEEGVSGVVDVNLLRRRLMADAGFTVSAAEAPQVRPLPLTLTLTPALTLARARARARAQSRCLRPLPRRCGPTLPRGPPEAAVRPRLSSRR